MFDIFIVLLVIKWFALANISWYVVFVPLVLWVLELAIVGVVYIAKSEMEE